jgi:uncharacterized protein
MALRLEPVDAAHADIVALLCGPLVLFPIGKPADNLSRRDLLAAKSTGAGKWQIESANGLITLLPFFSIADEPYSTYFKLNQPA